MFLTFCVKCELYFCHFCINITPQFKHVVLYLPRVLGTLTLGVLTATAIQAQRLPLPPRIKAAALALGKLSIDNGKDL